MIPILLDTCAVIWLAEEASMSKAAREAIAEAVNNQTPIYLSPISGWEVGLLISSGRLKLSVSKDVWFQRILARPQVLLTDLSLSTLLESSFLPGVPPRDPADRILAATAREKGYRIMTRDRKLLDYADDGHVEALAC